MLKKHYLKHTGLTLSDKLLLLPFLLYTLSLTFEGALRYYLYHMGIEKLIYFPKALMFLVFIFVIISDLTRSGLFKTYFILLCIVALSFFYGWHNTKNFYQAAFGIWVYAPFIYGVMALPPILKAGERGNPFILAIWLITISGIFCDYFSELPWTGFNYDVGQVLVEGARGWSTFGIERCGGFARASFSAAYLTLFSSVYIISTIRKPFLVTFVWIITGLALIATTHRASIAIYIILTIIFPIIFKYYDINIANKSYRILPIILALIGISLPCLSGVVFLNLNTYMEEFMLSSTGARLSKTWPDALSLIFERGNAILGRGLGGIGAPQLYFETSFYNPADNLYLSLFATFGIGMFLFITLWTIGLRKLDFKSSWHPRLFWLISVVILMEGWTANTIEDPLTAMLLGLSFGYTVQSRCWKPISQRAIKATQPSHIGLLQG